MYCVAVTRGGKREGEVVARGDRGDKSMML
jgi:hypothetical protein